MPAITISEPSLANIIYGARDHRILELLNYDIVLHNIPRIREGAGHGAGSLSATPNIAY